MMRAKNCLRRLRQLDDLIALKRQDLEELRARAEGVTQIIGDKVQAGGTNHNEELLVKLVEMENGVCADIERYVEERRYVTGVIDALEDARYIQVLYSYYVHKKTWEEIAVELAYSWRHVHRLHSEALYAFNEKMS